MDDIKNKDDMIELSNEIDDFVVQKCMEYNISPIEVAATVIARLYRVCVDVEQGNEYKALLQFASVENLEQYKDKPHLTLVKNGD